jgi:hypothetical protein
MMERGYNGLKYEGEAYNKLKYGGLTDSNTVERRLQGL